MAELPIVTDVRAAHVCGTPDGTITVWWTPPEDLTPLQDAGITSWVVQNTLEPRQRTSVSLYSASANLPLLCKAGIAPCVQFAVYGQGGSVQSPRSLPSVAVNMTRPACCGAALG